MALTKASLSALFAAYPNNNQNTVREFIDYIFTLTPAVPGGYLPLSGGTMTGNINMNGTQLIAAVLTGNTVLASAQSIVSPTGNEQLTFGSALNPAAQLLMNAGAEGFSAGTAIGLNNTTMFNALGAVAIGNGLNPVPTGRYLWFRTDDVDLVGTNRMNFNSVLLGFFGVPAVARQAAFTAPDNTDLSVELAAFPLTLAVINNIRTRLGEAATGLANYGLWN